MAAAPDAAVVVPVLPPPVLQVHPTPQDIVVEFRVDGGHLVAVLPLPPEHELRRSRDSVAEALASGRLAAVLPPPEPARRNTVAAVLARSRLAAAAADALMYLALAGLWIFQAGMAASDVAARALGEGSRAYAVAFEVSRVAILVVFLPVFPFALLLHAVRLAVSDTEPNESPAPKSFAAAAREVRRDTICVGTIALMAFVLLVVLGALVKGDSAAKGSCREMIGSVIGDVGLVGFHVINLFVLTPTLALRVWRVKLPDHGRRVARSGVAKPTICRDKVLWRWPDRDLQDDSC